MYAQQRRQDILHRLATSGDVSVSGLADYYDVSLETIRRDLDAMAEDGQILRVHGGAILPTGALEAPVSQRLEKNIEQKNAIARLALNYIPDTSVSIMLDSGTTTGAVAQVLPDRSNITVITNSVLIASALSERTSKMSVTLIGGQVRGITQATVGATTVEAISHYNTDIAFLGTNGMMPEAGFTTPNPTEAAAKRAMVRHTRTAIVVADADKFAQRYLVTFAEAHDIDVLISDTRLRDVGSDDIYGLAQKVELA